MYYWSQSETSSTLILWVKLNIPLGFGVKFMTGNSCFAVITIHLFHYSNYSSFVPCDCGFSLRCGVNERRCVNTRACEYRCLAASRCPGLRNNQNHSASLPVSTSSFSWKSTIAISTNFHIIFCTKNKPAEVQWDILHVTG